MLHKVLKLHPSLSVVVLSYIYIVSGLVVNLLQLLTFLLIRTVSERWGTWLNGYLHFSNLAIFTFVGDWLCNCKIRLYYEPSDIAYLNKEHTLCICNHRGEVDWQLGYMLLDRFRGLKGCKAIIKKEVQYLPVVGWLMWFTDYIFLSRSWIKDQQVIADMCSKLSRYDPLCESNYYVLMAEGTRYLPCKHKASLKFCEDRGLVPFRNVLYPRTKGATELVAQLGNTLGSIQNVVFAFPGDIEPDHNTMFEGRSTEIDIWFRRIPIDQVPINDKDAISDFIVDQFRNKDDLLEYHKTHGTFPGTPRFLPPRKTSLILFYMWATLSFGIGAVLLRYVLANSNVVVLCGLAGVFLIGALAANKIIGMAMLSKASSYGTAKPKEG